MHCKCLEYYIVLLLFVSLAGCGGTATNTSDIVEGFKNPGREARPRAYWNWLNGDVTHEGLTRDMEEAKDKGLAGLEMWDTEAMRNPDGFVPAGPPFMGPESVAAMHHCMKEAKRLGMELGLITSSGWNAGGPWVPPESDKVRHKSAALLPGSPGCTLRRASQGCNASMARKIGSYATAI